MISRVAEHCFWLHRFTERVENTARLLRVNRTAGLDVDVAEMDRWWPLVIVSGERERFVDRFGAEAGTDPERVQDYLTWDEQNPVSILTSLHWARENARTIREVVSLDMWESLNGFWHWLTGGAGRRLYRRNCDEFYRNTRYWPHQFYGLAHSTLLHEQPFDFMMLGLVLERAAQTARLLDVKHHMFGPESPDVETPIEHATWLGLLHSCSAADSFTRRRSTVSGPEIVSFLMFEKDFPRSIAHCVLRALDFTERIRSSGAPYDDESMALLEGLCDRIRRVSPEEVQGGKLHEELTTIIDSIASICDAVHADYFDPELPVVQHAERKERLWRVATDG